jgi:hypothetical protein
MIYYVKYNFINLVLLSIIVDKYLTSSKVDKI